MKFAWIKDHRDEFPIGAMCRVLSVSKAGFYVWCKRPISARAQRRAELVEKIAAVHLDSRCTYGSPRLTVELNARGVQVCENTVAKVMKQACIAAKVRRGFVPATTDSDHRHPIAANVLDRDFTATAPNRKWVCDITYIPTDEGWLYLSAVIDCFSRKVVGWSMADHLRMELVGDALAMAIQRRDPVAGLIHHSDRGVQYACGPYQQMLEQHGLVCSMSRKGNCYDNALAESFFATLKNELVNHEHYATRAQARASVFEYIEVFYNRQRRHSSLGYVSPETFEASPN
jgi:transposase InsO family protein